MKLYKMLLMAAFSIISISVFSQEKAGKKDTTQHLKLYTCPKHSDNTSEKEGYCSICGMKLNLTPKEKMKRDATKNYACPMHADIVSNKPGKCSKCEKDLVSSPKEKMKMEVIKKYSCSMHPDEASDKPGKCPKCNMDLVEKEKGQADHQH